MPAFVQAISQGAARLHHKLAVGVDVRNRAENLNRLPAILAELAQVADQPTARVPRHARRRADQALLGNAPPPSAIGRGPRPRRGDRDGAPTAAADGFDRRSRSRHQRNQRASAAAADHHRDGLAAGGLTLLFESFAYRRGVPTDADFVFDARCLPNPHWESRLRPLSGKDAPVREWLEAKTDVIAFRDDSGAVPRHLAAAVRSRRPQLCHDLHRLHRRPPSLGLSCRAARRAFPGDAPAGVELSPGA